ncbi:MAG: ribonuclease III, partial [Desulfobulbaceae bacterium]|nr:ribonuclease III [Desulfobulbaceae bacterium]
MTVTIESLVPAHAADLDRLEELLGYTFKERALLLQSLVHSSWAAENGLPVIGNNERLEFLGDAVLDLAVGAALFH